MNQMLIGNNENNEMLDETAKALITQRDHWRLSQMTFYCFTSECLRRYILRYFGEEASGYCGNCFNCLTQFEEVDISKETAAIIGCIKENWTAYGISTVIDILRGAKSQRILSKNLDKNSQYGALSMQSVTRLRQIIQEMLYQGYLELSGETYPVLKLGAGARKLSDSEATPMILKLPKEQEKRERAGSKGKRKKAGAASALREQDLKLFEELRAVRKDIAAEEKVPPYIIFSDKTLVLMCLVRPKNAADMLKISGVGEYKVQKYAEKFLTAIRQQ
jgi:ATP-dependent DNA helicase RecQ